MYFVRRLVKILLFLGLWVFLVMCLKNFAGPQNSTKKPQFSPMVARKEPPVKPVVAKGVAPRQAQLSKFRPRPQPPAIVWCLPLHYLPEPKNRPVTALASAPGSGNTWLRYLLQQASGVYTGSIYNDYDLKRKASMAEGVRDGSVSVVKLHEWGKKTLTLYQRAVLLVRAPGPAILAEFNRQSGGHTGLASITSFQRNNGKYWQGFLEAHLRDWQALNLAWLRNFTGPLHVVRYEALKQAVEPTLRATLLFLGLPVDEQALQCATARPDGAHKRAPRPEPFDPFTPAIKDKLNAAESLVFEEIRLYQSRHPPITDGIT